MKNNEKIEQSCNTEVSNVGWYMITNIVVPMCGKTDMDKVVRRTEQALVNPVEKLESQMKSVIASRMVENQSGV